MNQTWAILVAGGIGNRFGGDVPKQFLLLGGRSVIQYSLDVFRSISELGGTVLVLPEAFVSEWRDKLKPWGDKFVVTAGGQTRQESVVQGLAQVPSEVEWVLVHDAARPFITEDLVRDCLSGAQAVGAAVTALPVSDTVKRGDEEQNVLETVPRSDLFRIQTPQGFSKSLLTQALEWARCQGLDATDEATLVEKMGKPVRLVTGSEFNFKITRPEDLTLAEAIRAHEPYGSGHGRKEAAMNLRIGEGYDVHPFVEGRELILGGVPIPFELGLKGHSDADALSHAVGDALLGAASLGDLGAHFPDSDPQFKGISSLVLLEKIRELLGKKGFQVGNVDATLICQRPKLATHIPAMRENLAHSLSIGTEQVSIKATTEEGLGFTGRMEGLAARAVVLIQKRG